MSTFVLDSTSFTGIISCISQIISGVALINWLTDTGKCPSLTFGIGPSDGIKVNIPFLGWITLLILAILSFVMAIFEIIILIKPEWPSYINNHFFRCVIYILKGASVIGVSGDFGITAGIIEIFIGLCNFVLFMINFFKGLESFTAANAYQNFDKTGPNKPTKTAVVKKKTVVKK